MVDIYREGPVGPGGGNPLPGLQQEDEIWTNIFGGLEHAVHGAGGLLKHLVPKPDPHAMEPVPIHGVFGGGEAPMTAAAGAAIIHHAWTTFLPWLNPHTLIIGAAVAVVVGLVKLDELSRQKMALSEQAGRDFVHSLYPDMERMVEKGIPGLRFGR